jgi:hypothetical protein
MSDDHNRQETDSQRERRIGYAEFALAVKELTRLANSHETEIAVLKEQHRTMETHIRALEALIGQLGHEVVTTRDSVSSTVGSVKIAIAEHIASDERSQKFVLWSLLCFLILNGGAVIGWLISAWVGSGMPWPIFPWL